MSIKFHYSTEKRKKERKKNCERKLFFMICLITPRGKHVTPKLFTRVTVNCDRAATASMHKYAAEVSKKGVTFEEHWGNFWVGCDSSLTVTLLSHVRSFATTLHIHDLRL